MQIEAGASAVQLFDSWAGGLTPMRLPGTRAAAQRGGVLRPSPTSACRAIHFGVATGELLADMATAGVEVMGVDWRVPLDRAVERIQPGQAVQGNLDPRCGLAPWEVLEAEARDVVERGRAASGHIFNLGHGVLPGTDPDVLAAAGRPHSLG